MWQTLCRILLLMVSGKGSDREGSVLVGFLGDLGGNCPGGKCPGRAFF